MIPIIDQILGRFSQDLAIDLGTANTLIYVRGKGIALREPSIITCHKKTKKVLAIGLEAKKMVGKTPFNIETIRPLARGVIADFDTTLSMFNYFVRKTREIPGKRLYFSRPRMIIGVPTCASEVERRAVLDLAGSCGARLAFLVEEPLAAAIGAGLSIAEPVGSLVVDIGGGTSEIAVISLGGIVVGRSLRIAGNSMDTDIINYVRFRWGLALGEKTAEEIKISLGSAYPGPIEKEMVVRGRDLEKGLPKSIRLTSSQVREALAPSINVIVSTIKEILADAPPELASDIAERGIVVCGGGSQISGLPKLISAETKMPVTVADDPGSCVVRGCGLLLENVELLAKVKVVDPK
ncbi:rod shape-determining protein [Candidatus Curtissbacteria bacterium RIFCSPHIGHO2_01_FULL_41_44]|uniref:Cell shape-determining protein MreB n=1 Tax=Candidatus Curtissbacteria bacterium RIFCSPLOWO2_01_FULL_42_50 TaxID=1797730 RepID=A0A1F5H6X7_9BACT|nr:MAG: rod shape-determining protein [Candidatus Curtissbacteria bacterium RIFCSPHIGHO2_02_FULL_42_58]OGD94417.1 MAG: rod shape-determining protein [Candidatus Curtissbacteria bacterium RIFCSPHIGHO2_01_FULL_41_44]OGD97691.1 MAG: rod shape-determining protein [Candidatus Curtissbacteria bacterium RIFCSPHIGHO2_12_FULL_42_33]OGD99922.1 MAG: rod shape-determining protein [Candidatus Curtissbacteria bacterium RIFCSPLOWO2_01_FULL_42_50]OGE02803.1 MAG: rod shape-determining protein [Candidatus Curtis